MSQAEKQTIFDAALSGVRAQGGPSVLNNGCAYRGENGRKCGVGHLLRDDEVDEANNMVAVDKMILPSRLVPHLELLVWIQHSHDWASNIPFGDEVDFMQRFEARMKFVAGRCGLRYLPMSEVVALSDDPQILARASDLRGV